MFYQKNKKEGRIMVRVREALVHVWTTNEPVRVADTCRGAQLSSTPTRGSHKIIGTRASI